MRKNRSPAPPPDCPLTECLKVIGGAWTPNILWHLVGGPRRFSELRQDIPGVSAKVLTTRLRHLEGSGVICRQVMPTSPPSVEYALTELGAELAPAIDAIVQVGHRLKQLRGSQPKAFVGSPDQLLPKGVGRRSSNKNISPAA
ncbi:MAG: helix-turn-helix domain-containing protein [Erythrobacter sp.]|nr:helix-turn-helix domain-containing protein [Erythrobacter sp.]MDZ4273627.1 helix-turn-helix domain-containing protein [Erythrobacter sp.]